MIEYFPEEYTPRDDQIKIASAIKDSLFKDNKKFTIIQAPTGTGKSMIAKMIANASKEPTEQYLEALASAKSIEDLDGFETYGASILTTTKQLQDQYKQTFSDTEILKGQSNYVCAVDDTQSVATGPCHVSSNQLKTCKRECLCPYFETKKTATKAHINSMNYSKFLTLEDQHKRRQYLICDEASELEDSIISEFTLRLTFKELSFFDIKIGYSSNANKMHSHLSDCMSGLADYIDNIKPKIKTATGAQKQKYSKTYKSAADLLRSIRTVVNNWHSCEYIIQRDAKSITFTPLKANVLAQHVFEHATHVVLMSATIVDIKQFTDDLGIKQGEYNYIDHPSSFDPDQSPVYVFPDQALNSKNLLTVLENSVIPHIENILGHHSNEKGIIHTHTNNITEFIFNKLSARARSRLLVRKRGQADNEAIIQQHTESDQPTVLMSPSLTFGVDLKDDLARFGIIVKLPYLPLMDKRIQTRSSRDRNWYITKMITNFIQACGRTTRNTGDHSVTYVMDSGLLNVLERERNKFPSYFLKRF